MHKTLSTIQCSCTDREANVHQEEQEIAHECVLSESM